MIFKKRGAETKSAGAPSDTEPPLYATPDRALKLFFRNYFNFRGRSTRSELCYAVQFILVFGISFYLLYLFYDIIFPLNIFGIIVFIPLISCIIRRLHDAGESAWLYVAVFASGGLFWLLFNGIKTVCASDSGTGATLPQVIYLAVTLFSAFVAVVLLIVSIVKICSPSQPFENKYGREPHTPKDY